MNQGPSEIDLWRGDAAALASLRPPSTGVPFLRKLLQLIEGEGAVVDVRHILFWSKNGRYLVLCDEADFFQKVCNGVVFHQKSISNFNKQMNNWRWRRVARKDVVAVASRDDTIWNDRVRLWEHQTLTRDSSDLEIDAVTRQPDGMAKKRRMLGRSSPQFPRSIARRAGQLANRRRRNNSESEAEETETEEFEHKRTPKEVETTRFKRAPSLERPVPILALQEPTPPIPDERRFSHRKAANHLFDFPERPPLSAPHIIRRREAHLLAPPPQAIKAINDEPFWATRIPQIQTNSHSLEIDPLSAFYNPPAPPSAFATPLEAHSLADLSHLSTSLQEPVSYPQPHYLRPPTPAHPASLPELQLATVSPIHSSWSSTPSPGNSNNLQGPISYTRNPRNPKLFKGITQRQSKNLKCIAPADRLRGRQSSSSSASPSLGVSTQMLPDQNTPTRATFGFGRLGDLADFLDGMCSSTPLRTESGVGATECFEEPWFGHDGGAKARENA